VAYVRDRNRKDSVQSGFRFVEDGKTCMTLDGRDMARAKNDRRGRRFNLFVTVWALKSMRMFILDPIKKPRAESFSK
jgi:hypothetical protein